MAALELTAARDGGDLARVLARPVRHGLERLQRRPLQHKESTVNWLGYIGTADFWEATLQNWQSEFLAVGSITIFTVFLRQRGSPQSKPVGAPHGATAEEG